MAGYIKQAVTRASSNRTQCRLTIRWLKPTR